MPSISGNLSYASSRFGGIGSLSAIRNIPIVIQNISSNVGVGVLTDISGNYTVSNIPSGSYRIVEAYGFVGAVTSPANFLVSSTTISIPTPKDPPLSAMTVTLANTNQVDSLSPNTLYATVVATDITGRNFVDSSIQNNPLSLPTGVLIGNNILTYAGNGIWGTLPNGTSINTVPAVYPYTISMPASLLVYVTNLNAIGFNNFSMSNIAIYQWFCLPNHTTFDETSSFMLVNGGDPNALLFQETVNVTPNTFYLASAWFIMITNLPGTCLIGIRVLAQDGTTVLFYGQTSNVLYGNWGELGQIFNVKNNTQVTVQVLTMSTVASGNDFALDDVQLKTISFDNNVTFNKYVDKPIALIGDTLKYTSVLTTNINLFNGTFQDTIPLGTNFNSGTVNINGTTFPSYNPNAGFTLPAMSGGSINTITFDVTVVSVPTGNNVTNTSNTTYSSIIIPGNTIVDTLSSTVSIPTLIQDASIYSIKSVDRDYSTVGDTLVYTVTLLNTGNVSAGSIIFKDTIPSGTTLVNNSFSLNGSTINGADPSNPIDIGTLPAGGISTISFNVVVTTIPSPNPIPNSSSSTFNILVNTSLNTIPKGHSNSNIVYTKVNLATISSSKSVSKSYADIGDILNYNISIKNTGNVTANNIVLIDSIPNGVSVVSGSLNQDGVLIAGSTNPPGVTLPNNIGIGATSTITFNVVVITIPSPNPIVNSASQSYSYIIDPSTTPNRLGVGSNNTNSTQTTVNNANLSNIIKSVDKNNATCGDILTYTITITNTGSTTAINVFVVDTVPNGTILVLDSVIVNGNTISGANPSTGITIPNITANSLGTISFKVQVVC